MYRREGETVDDFVKRVLESNKGLRNALREERSNLVNLSKRLARVEMMLDDVRDAVEEEE